MLTCLSYRTIIVNLLTHRHAITRAWAVMYPWLSDKNIHKLFSIKTLMHTNTSSKTTHILKTSLIKQCYTWYAWTGANNAADTDMLLILLYCWYWYAADTVMLLIYWYCWYVCSILRAQCSVLDQYIFHYCITLKSCSC
jgi:hypothetical protein